MVAPTPMNRRPAAPRTQPRAVPPSARRRPPPGYRGTPPRRHRRRLPLLILLVVTAAAAGYLLLGRSSGSPAPQRDFVHTAQQIARIARTLPVDAQRVQVFAEVHEFDQESQLGIVTMQYDVQRIRAIEARSTGSARQIADQAATAGDQAIDAAGRYRRAVVFTYRLSNADTARQDLATAASILDQQVKAWPHR